MHRNPQASRCLNPDMWGGGDEKNLLLKKSYREDLCRLAITVEEDVMITHFTNSPVEIKHVKHQSSCIYLHLSFLISLHVWKEGRMHLHHD